MSQTGLLQSQRGKRPYEVKEAVAACGGDDGLPSSACREKFIPLKQDKTCVDDATKVSLLLTVEDREAWFEGGVGCVRVKEAEKEVKDGVGRGGCTRGTEGVRCNLMAVASMEGGGRPR